jgi:hypothetical protein
VRRWPPSFRGLKELIVDCKCGEGGDSGKKAFVVEIEKRAVDRWAWL